MCSAKTPLTNRRFLSSHKKKEYQINEKILYAWSVERIKKEYTIKMCLRVRLKIALIF